MNLKNELKVIDNIKDIPESMFAELSNGRGDDDDEEEAE